jgi:unsaturated rhamnogalacturonyl hydrolase
MSTDYRTTLQKAASKLPALEYHTWFFGDSTGFEGMMRGAEVLDAPALEEFAYGWFRAWATRATPYRRDDCTAPGLAIVLSAEKHGNQQLLEAAIGLADYLTTRRKLHGTYETFDHSPLMRPYSGEELSPREREMLENPPAGVFIDCLHFDPPFFAALARVTGDSRWETEALEQAAGYVGALQQDSGLFNHFILRGFPDESFGPGWGRGQGWALLGLLDVVEQLNLDATSEPARAARALIDAMIPLQRDDGHWPVNILDDSSGDEPSTAAFMATGFLRAIKLGLVEPTIVEGYVNKALSAVVADVDDDGYLTGVSRAVMACTTPSHYSHVPRGFNVPWGQGPLVLALCEALDYGIDS